MSVEGALDQERAYRKSQELLDVARLKMDAYFRLKERLGWHLMELKECTQHFQGWESLEDKRELWHAERRVERARRELQTLFTSATEVLSRALSHDPATARSQPRHRRSPWNSAHGNRGPGQIVGLMKSCGTTRDGEIPYLRCR